MPLYEFHFISAGRAKIILTINQYTVSKHQGERLFSKQFVEFEYVMKTHTRVVDSQPAMHRVSGSQKQYIQ